MKAFPEPISVSAFFTSWDGRFTTEAQILIQRAQVFLQNARNHDDADDIRKAITVLTLLARAQGFPRGLVLVLAGTIAGALDRRPRVYSLVGSGFMRLVVFGLEGIARARGLDGNAPAWNDYVLAYWMMTGNPDAVEELFYRATDPATDPALLPIKESAESIVAMVRGDCAEFDRAYREVEANERSAAAAESYLASNTPAGVKGA
jgi:hypothetical protein